MTRFEQEWSLVPVGARWTAVLVCLAVAALTASIFLLPALAERDPTAFLVVTPFFLLTLVGVAFLGAYVLLVGYVYGDARRRGMNRVLWTLLAIFIPNAIGIILYFILRDPIPVPCPACGMPAKKGHAYCAGCGAAVRPACPACGVPAKKGHAYCAACGTAVRPACPACREPVEPGWRNCARCGAAVGAAPVPSS